MNKNNDVNNNATANKYQHYLTFKRLAKNKHIQ